MEAATVFTPEPSLFCSIDITLLLYNQPGSQLSSVSVQAKIVLQIQLSTHTEYAP